MSVSLRSGRRLRLVRLRVLLLGVVLALAGVLVSSGVAVAAAPTLSISDASVVEGDTGSVDAVFTVTLSGDPTGPVTVNYASSFGSAGNQDITPVSGTLNLSATNPTAEVRVPVLGDTQDEPTEAFFVNLSSASGASISDSSGVGFIQDNDPAELVISEARFAGPNGPNDEFVEITNRSQRSIDISNFEINNCQGPGAFDLVHMFPFPTVLAPGQSYTVAGSTYSGDQPVDATSSRDIDPVQGARLSFVFAQSKIDGVGGAGSDCAEGGGITHPPNGGEYSFVRKTSANVYVDTDDNASDFDFIAPSAAAFDGIASKLGMLGVENQPDPRRLSTGFMPSLFDPSQTSSGSNNRSVDANNSVMRVRRRLTNTSGQTITDLRLRVHRLTTLGNRSAGQADLRLISAAGETLTVGGTARTLRATTLERAATCPASVPRCGGLNSRVQVDLPAGGVPPGGSVDFNLDFYIQQSGSFSLFLVPEVLP